MIEKEFAILNENYDEILNFKNKIPSKNWLKYYEEALLEEEFDRQEVGFTEEEENLLSKMNISRINFINHSRLAFEQFIIQLSEATKSNSEEQINDSIQKLVTELRYINTEIKDISTGEREDIGVFFISITNLTGLNFKDRKDIFLSWENW